MIASSQYTPEVAEEYALERQTAKRLEHRFGRRWQPRKYGLNTCSLTWEPDTDAEIVGKYVISRLSDRLTAVNILLRRTPAMLEHVYRRACDKRDVQVLTALIRITQELATDGAVARKILKRTKDGRACLQYLERCAKHCGYARHYLAAIAGN